MLRFLREGLRRPLTEPRPPVDPAFAALAANLNETVQRRLGHSLAIRQVDAGSCNGCELEIHALNNAFYDIERFGIHFVASPRHADVLLVTGPVTHNMQQAARLADYTGFFLMGKLIEFDDTRKIFQNPKQKDTEDYVTGRFG